MNLQFHFFCKPQVHADGFEFELDFARQQNPGPVLQLLLCFVDFRILSEDALQP